MKRFICFLSVLLLFINIPCAQAVSTSAACAVLIDADTGRVLYAENEQTRASMASTTKIMTALILCENKDLSETLKITDEMVRVEGTSMGLKAGMTVTYKDLLYGMLLPSGNDAANATAIGISGSIEKFVELMNRRAEKLGLNNTHFETPSGLDGETHYTTALELALITRTALLNKDFAEACKTKNVTLEYGGAKHTLTNHNRLLRMNEDFIGVKTGFTKKSGRCLVSAANRNGITLIAVTLNDGNDWNDHKELINYGFGVVKGKTVSFGEESYTLDVVSGKEKSLTVKSDAVTFSCSSEAQISKDVYLEKYLYAPIKSGDKVGYIEYKKGTTVIAKQELLAQNSVELEDRPKFSEKYIRNLILILGEVL